MTFRGQFSRALLLGYVDENDPEFGALPITDVNGGLSVVLKNEGDYEFDDLVAGVTALAVEEGGDDYLDLGDSDKDSPWTVVQRQVTKRELDARTVEKEALDGYTNAWKEEVRQEKEREHELMSFARRDWV